MSRQAKVTITPKAGSLDRMYLWVDHTRRISANGDVARSWEGSVKDSEATFTVVVVGSGSAKYRLEIDLPGEQSDLKSTHTLDDGYHRLQVEL